VSFGSDIGEILRSGLAPLGKLMAIAVRYHHPDGAGAQRLAQLTGTSRSTAYELLEDVVSEGYAEKVGARWVARLPSGGPGDGHEGTGETPDVRHADKSVRNTDSPDVRNTDTDVRHADTNVRNTDMFVRHADTPPAPPNKEIQTFSRPSPDAATAAPAHARETPVDSGEVGGLVDAWWRTQGGMGRRAPGLFPPPAVVDAVAELLQAHGAERVRWAIGAAVDKTRNGSPSLGFLRKLAGEGPLPDLPPMPASARGRRSGPASLSVGKAPPGPTEPVEAERDWPPCPRCSGAGCTGWDDGWVCIDGRRVEETGTPLEIRRDMFPESRFLALGGAK
jgi:hypothetical protein